jgi:two-component system chemotaxis response regulator CheY
MEDNARNQKIKVLIVDDSDFSRSHISKVLTDQNYNVIGEAASASEAMEILKTRKPHIAIIDIVMPEISGIELTDTINKNFKNINIIMISSLAQENIIIDAISAGAADFIQKPFKADILLSSIDKLKQDIHEETA